MPEGRSTRSQVTLPDAILHVSQESPLKKARSQRQRITTNTTSSTQSDQDDDDERPDAGDDEDELLLSPQKIGQSSTESKGGKRSASPPIVDEYTEPSSLSEGRVFKRLKRDLNHETRDAEESTKKPRSTAQARLPSHARNFSDSSAAPPKRAKRQTSKPSSKKPNSTGHVPPTSQSSPPLDLHTGRAQSVPLFFSSLSLPHIDLRRPPPSPTRNRSRSPSKELTPRLHINPIPNMPTSLESILDEPSTHMNIDTDPSRVPSSSPAEPISVDNTPTVADTPVEPASPIVKLSEEVQVKQLETPMTSGNASNLGYSPLTPVLDTPHPQLATQHKLETMNADSEEVPPTPLPSQAGATLAAPKRTLIPRRSTGALSQTAQPQQKPVVTKKPLTKPLSMAAPKTRQATLDQMFGPQEAKARTAMPRVKSKTKMKPKRKGAEPAPAPALVPIPSDEEEAEVDDWRDQGADDAVDSKIDEGNKIKEAEVALQTESIAAAILDAEVRTALGSMVESPSAKATIGMDDQPLQVHDQDVPMPSTEIERTELGDAPTEDVEMDGQRGSEQLAGQGAEIRAKEGVDARDKDVGAGIESEADTRSANDAEKTAEVQVETRAEVQPQGGKRAETSVLRTKSKLPRLPTTTIGSSRTTRSSSAQKAKPAMPPPAVGKVKSVLPKLSGSTKPVSTTGPKSKKPRIINADPGQLTEKSFKLEQPGSPMKVSPVRQSLAPSISSPSLKLTISSPSKSRIPVMTHTSSPSPAKLVRSASLFSPPSSDNHFNPGGSTLSTLSDALEKLRMPAPSRPNTSMGFNRDLTDDDDSPIAPNSQIQDDSNVGKKSASQVNGKGAQFGRSTTLGAPQFLSKEQQPNASGSKPLKQSTLQFPKAKMVGPAVRGKPIIGVGWGKAPKASKNPGLATVIGSPVKGGRNLSTQEAEEDELEMLGGVPAAKDDDGSSFFLDSTVPVAATDKGKGKPRDEFSSRRASMVSLSLSESLNSFPSENTSGKGLMGPPAVPNLSARSSISLQSPTSATGESSTPPGRRSTRIAAVAAIAMSKKAAEPEKPPVNEALKFLRDCIIFVDVKTEDSEEAGSLFVEMLEGIGARLLQRVGQSCTHIVFKNGLQSTINRYKLLRDPKPLVVGIAWVVDCVEQRKKVDETDYLIDLEEVNLLTNPGKRRRSMLPKLISHHISDVSMSSDLVKDESNEGDLSIESASSSVLDDLPPLERARRRKSMLPT